MNVCTVLFIYLQYYRLHILSPDFSVASKKFGNVTGDILCNNGILGSGALCSGSLRVKGHIVHEHSVMLRR